MTTTRIGSWMQTYTGRAFYPLDARVEDIDIVDIAHALARICRYGGHTTRHYSVAEHCVLMADAVPEEFALWALLHDSTEAYIGDMVRPLKRHMPAYVEAEDRLMDVICDRYGLPHGMPPEVKDADNRIITVERHAVMGPSPLDWATDELEPLPVVIRAWSPQDAEDAYLDAFTRYYKEPTP